MTAQDQIDHRARKRAEALRANLLRRKAQRQARVSLGTAASNAPANATGEKTGDE